jgi:hypothetical protein
MHLRNRGVAGQRRGDVLVVLPSGQISIVDVVVTHPSQQAHVNQACTRPGHAAAQAERSEVTEFRRIGEDASQYDFVPFAVEVETCHEAYCLLRCRGNNLLVIGLGG